MAKNNVERIAFNTYFGTITPFAVMKDGSFVRLELEDLMNIQKMFLMMEMRYQD